MRTSSSSRDSALPCSSSWPGSRWSRRRFPGGRCDADGRLVGVARARADGRIRAPRARPGCVGMAARHRAHDHGPRHARPDAPRCGTAPRPFGAAVLGTGVSGEFWPIVVISVFLTGTYGATTEIGLLLVAFGLVVAAGGYRLRARPPRIVRIIQQTVLTTRSGGRPAVATGARSARPPRPGRGLRPGAGRPLGGDRRRPRDRLVRRRGRAGAARGHRVRLPRPDLLRRHGNDI